MTAVALAAPLVAAFAVRLRIERSGARAGLAQLGVSERDLARAVLPALAIVGMLGGGFVWTAEPVAWTVLHGLRDSPAATAAVLGRLAAGETLSVDRGGLVLAPTGSGLEVWSESGWTASAGALVPDANGWQLENLTVRTAQGVWHARTLRLHPVQARARPLSPLAHRFTELMQEGSPRSRLVLHRRLSIPLLALLLGLTAWLLAGGTSGAVAGARLAGLGLGAFLVLRGADHVAGEALVGGAAAGWLPTGIAAALLLALLRARP
jgi:hypothetical protein